MEEVMYSEFYNEAFAALSRPLTDADRLTDEVLAAHEQRLGVRLPNALRAYYAATGKMEQLNKAYNCLLAPEEWRIDRRVLVFLSENQGVTKWGVEATKSRRVDPSVLYTFHAGQGEQSEWAREEVNCSDFLVLMLCWQAVHGGMPYSGWAQVDTADGEAVVARWNPTWHSRDLQAGYRPGQALCIAGLPSLTAPCRRLDILAAGRSEAEFMALVQELASLGIVLEMQ